MSPDKRDSEDLTSFTGALVALPGSQTVDAQLNQDNNTWEDPGNADDNVDIKRELIRLGVRCGGTGVLKARTGMVIVMRGPTRRR